MRMSLSFILLSILPSLPLRADVAGGTLRRWIASVHLGLGALFLGAYAGHVLFAAARSRVTTGARQGATGQERDLLPAKTARQEVAAGRDR